MTISKFTKGRNDRGANLVEFALIMPLLLLLVLGTVEFGWILARNLDVNQGAREGARMIAVDSPSGNSAMEAEICSRMSLVGGDSATMVSWTGSDTDSDGTIEVGEGVTVTVTSPTTPTLTGLLDFFFAAFPSMESSVEIRVEQPPTWTNQSPTACP